MSFSLDKILNSTYLPHWLEECEIQQGTWDISQDISLDSSLETYNSSVYGISNRPLATLYAISKIISQILRDHHFTNGSHHIEDIDVITNALIRESPDINNDGENDYLSVFRKLLLDFYGMPMPDEAPAKDYSTTRELAEKVASLFEYIDLLRKGLGSHIAFKYTIQSFIEKELGVTGFIEFPEIEEDTDLILKSCTLLINGMSITIPRSVIPLTAPVKTFSNNAEVLYVKLYFTSLTDSCFPMGNRALTPIINTVTSEWLLDITNKENNIYIDSTFHLSQLQYLLCVDVFDPSTSTYGIDQVISNLTKSSIRGVWLKDDYMVFPIMVITRRNKGIYHCSMNPGGTSLARTVPTSSSECFEYEKISYFFNDSECPNYSTYVDDYYSYSSIIYDRSGTVLSNKTGNPLGYFCDKVYVDDIITIGKKICLDNTTIVNELCEKIFANELYTELSPVMKGLTSAITPGVFYSRNPVQTLGFGETTEQLFGLDNKGGLFVDECNNELDGVTDHIRTYWGDPSYNAPISFSFTEGNNNSETRSFLTYESVSQVITLNTTALSGTPNISIITPVMVWDDGTTVVHSNWTGLGTTSAFCVITPKTGRTVYGLTYFTYSLGSGVPYILDGTIKILDLNGVSYNFCIQKSETFCLACTWTGLPISGDTDHIVLPTCIDCDFPNDLVNGYALVLSGNNAGEYRKISSYDCDSRVVLFESDFTTALTNTDKISIGKLEPNKTTIVINPFGRGITGAFKRRRVLTSSVRYFSTLPIVDYSDGTLTGTMLSDLTNGVYIEVITREDEPLTTGFYIYTICNPMFNQYKAIPDCSLKIIKAGNLIDTTKGSANTPFSIYRQFVPSYSTKTVDETKWISTDCESPYFKIKPLEYWDINYSLRPTENLVLDCLNSVITTRKLKLGDIQSVISDIITVLPNNRMVMGVTLVEILGWYYLLCTPRHVGTFGLNRGFIIDVNKIY